jgi:pimeloyl-ACP methyl ester carboxylesterase
MQLAGGRWVEFDDAGQGQPVVLLHAFPLARGMWQPQVAALSGAYRVLTPDLPGFGGTSGIPSTPSVQAMAEVVGGLLDALGLQDQVVLGGLSMGGYVALAFVRQYPHRLRALILADTRAEADTEEGKSNRDKLISFARGHTARDVLEQMLPKLVGGATLSQRPAVVEEVRRLAAAQTPAGVIGALEAMRDRPDSTDLLASIRVPTLVLVGSEDALTPPPVAQTLAAGIPGASLTTIPGAGHLANLEQPAAFNEALRSFLLGRY